MQSLNDIHGRWASANHDSYKEGQPRTAYLIDLIKSVFISHKSRILEIGCNIGRNLNGLRELGFAELHGVEINPNTKHIRETVYPELAEIGHFKYLPLEEYLKTSPEPFDLVYTMAVLEHIHPDSEWVFAELHKLVKPGGHFILIEDEINKPGLPFVFPRSYERLEGLQPVFSEDCRYIPGLENSCTTRIFRRSNA
jgi:SAM-dependent methyltransferase